MYTPYIVAVTHTHTVHTRFTFCITRHHRPGFLPHHTFTARGSHTHARFYYSGFAPATPTRYHRIYVTLVYPTAYHTTHRHRTTIYRYHRTRVYTHTPARFAHVYLRTDAHTRLDYTTVTFTYGWFGYGEPRDTRTTHCRFPTRWWTVTHTAGCGSADSAPLIDPTQVCYYLPLGLHLFIC